MTRDEAASELRVALRSLEEGCVPTAAHFARRAAAALTELVAQEARQRAPDAARLRLVKGEGT